MAANVNDHKKVLQDIVDLIGKQRQCAVQISPESTQWLSELDAQKKKMDEDFMVLIVGTFNAGKSSLINALIGEQLLPTGMLPETGVLSEIHYGEEKRLTLYPKPGKWEGGDEPFDLNPPTLSEIAKYCSIDNAAMINKEPDSSNVKFEKLVITWPLEMLKSGVTVVDTVGLNDPYGNDYITKEYFPKADAVIYLMNGTTPYTMDDQDLLDELNAKGLNNIICVCTYYDVVAANNHGMPEKLELYRNTIRAHCSDHSVLGDESVHFVDSLTGLKARRANDENKLVESGIAGLERYLNRYLVVNKGRLQVDGITGFLRNNLKKVIESSKTQDATSMLSSQDLEMRIKHAKEQLAITENNARTTKRSFRMLMESNLPTIDLKIEQFYEQLPEKVNLDQFTPQVKLPEGFENLNLIQAARKSKALTKECAAAIGAEVKKQNNNWTKEELFPFINEHVKRCAQDIQLQVEKISKDLEEVDVILDGGVNPTALDTAASVASRALALIGGMLVGDPGLMLGGLYGGAGNLLRTLGFEFLGAITMGVVAGILSAPVSAPLVFIAMIGGALVGIIADGSAGKIKRAKKEAVKKYRERYRKNNEAKVNADTVKNNIHKWISSVCDAMDAALDQDVDEKRKLIETTIRNAQGSLEEKKRNSALRAEAVKELQAIDKTLVEIRKSYELTV